MSVTIPKLLREEILVAARVHNSGHATAHDVVVVLPVPDRTTYVAGSATLFLSGEAGRLGGNLYAANALVERSAVIPPKGGTKVGPFCTHRQM